MYLYVHILNTECTSTIGYFQWKRLKNVSYLLVLLFGIFLVLKQKVYQVSYLHIWYFVVVLFFFGRHVQYCVPISLHRLDLLLICIYFNTQADH